MAKLTYNTINWIMGCGCGTNNKLESTQQQLPYAWPYKNVGSLIVEIRQINFVDQYNKFESTSDNYIKLSMSSQYFVTMLHHNFGNITKITTQKNLFHFIINKNDPQRTFQLQIFKKQPLRSYTKLAFSRQSIAKSIHEPKQNKKSTEELISCKLINTQGTKIAWVKMMLKFRPQKYRVLNVKVNSVTLRSNFLKERRIYVRIQIGEDIFQSVSAIENSKTIPEWSDAVCSFMIPSGLTQGSVQVYQKKQSKQNDCLLGQLRFNLAQILNESGLQSDSQHIKIGLQVTGIIKLQFLQLKNDGTQNIVIKAPRKIAIDSKETLQKKMVFQRQNDESSNKKSDQPTTNVSDPRLPEDIFLIKIKKSQKSALNQPTKINSNTKLPPVQSAPVGSKQKRQINSVKLQSKRKNQQIEENPQSQKVENSSQLIGKSDQNYYNENESNLLILKTQSVLFHKESQNLKPSRNQAQESEGFDTNKIKIHRINSNDGKQINLSRHDKTIGFDTKDQIKNNDKVKQQQNIEDQDCMVYSKTLKFIPNNDSKKKTSDRKRQIPQNQKSSVLKFDQIQRELQSNSLKSFNNSVINIVCQQDNNQLDFMSLKENSNMDQHDTDSWQSIHLGKQTKAQFKDLSKQKAFKKQKPTISPKLTEQKSGQDSSEDQSILNSRILRQYQRQHQHVGIIS